MFFFSKASSLSLPPYDQVTQSPIRVSQQGVYKMLRKLKNGKAAGPDGLTKNDLSMDMNNTAANLTLIFQYSLDSGTLPDIWKTANVVPIFKIGDREDSGNYRPVSLTCIACKLLEHIVLSHLSPIFEGFLCPEQHGFRRGLSCATQLVSTTNSFMTSIDRGVTMHAAVLDFSKAFDRVSHGLLINKLHDIGIDTLLIK